MDDMYLLSHKEEKKRYLEHNNTLKNKGYKEMLKKFIESGVSPYIKRSDKKNLQVLDFGCGPGPVLKLLLEKKDIAVDIYDPYFFPDKVYLNKRYDLITATEVVEHLKNPLFAWDLYVEHLRKNGCLAVMTLFHPGVENFLNWWYRNDPTHICFYSKKTFQWIETKYPFKIMHSNDYNIIVMRLIL